MIDTTANTTLLIDLAKDTALPIELVQLLVARGYTTKQAIDDFLYPKIEDLSSPYALANMAEGASKIKEHIENGDKIVIFGDYDCDGVGAAAILFLTLKALSASVEVFIPSRQEDGYGLSIEAIKRVISAHSPKLLITVDCGISSVKEIEYAAECGVDVLITDHHEPQEKLPDCLIIDPKLQSEVNELCGAGVVLKLVEALTDKQNAMQYIDICAISTIADLVPLKGDNRIIARAGLVKLSNAATRRPGIKALLKVSGNIDRGAGVMLTSTDVAFRLAPRLNAAGRLSSAQKAFKLLIEDDPTELSLIAEELELENKRRQELCAEVIDDCKELLKSYDLAHNRIIVLASDKWEGGVVGIAAAKLTQDFNRPTVLFAPKDDLLKGSCRSISGVNVHDLLTECKQHVVQFGGHSMAAGLSIKRENFDAFFKAINSAAEKYDDAIFEDNARFDIELDFKKINLKFVHALDCFEPYGMSNPKPIFRTSPNGLAFQRIGKYNHIKYSPNRECEAVIFNAANKRDLYNSDIPKHIYYNVETEVFRNVEKAKCFVKRTVFYDIDVSSDMLLVEYFQTYLDGYLTAGETSKAANGANGLYGHLVVVYSMEAYREAVQTYPNYARAYRTLISDNPINTILLAPAPEVSFAYFAKVDFIEIPSDAACKRLERDKNIKLSSRKPVFDAPISKLGLDKLRLIYTYYLMYQNTHRFCGFDLIYDDYIARGNGDVKRVFYIATQILQEIGLITLQNGSIIINKTKADPCKSEIYKSLEEICGNFCKK